MIFFFFWCINLLEQSVCRARVVHTCWQVEGRRQQAQMEERKQKEMWPPSLTVSNQVFHLLLGKSKFYIFHPHRLQYSSPPPSRTPPPPQPPPPLPSPTPFVFSHLGCAEQLEDDRHALFYLLFLYSLYLKLQRERLKLRRRRSGRED